MFLKSYFTIPKVHSPLYALGLSLPTFINFE